MNPRKILKITTINKFFYLWVLFLFALVTFIYDKKLAYFETGVFIVLTLVYVISGFSRRNQILDYFEELTLTMDTASKESLMNFPLPVVVVKFDGKIAWYNELFLNMIQPDKSNPHFDFGFENYINEYICDIKVEDILSDDYCKIINNKKIISFDLKYKDVVYHAFGSISDIDDDKIIVLYFADVTAHEELKTIYDDEKFVSSIIVIDNFDDIIQNTPSADRPLLFAAYDATFDKIAEEAGGIVKKIEKDRYLFYFHKKYLKEYSENKFDFLKKFDKISDNPKRIPTFSIGVGAEGETMAQNDALSFAALDMAIGRGGDQVAIKTPNKFLFFGGSVKEIERRTRVRARVISNALSDLINNAENVIVTGHKNADMDVIGAAFGVCRIVKNRGKDVKILMETCNQTVSAFKDTLTNEYSDLFVNSKYVAEIITKNTLIIVVDTHVTSLLENHEILKRTDNIVVIDHHRRNPDFINGVVLTYLEPYASSTSELITELLQCLDDVTELSTTEAVAMYAGIYLDTKNFTFKTGARTFDSASYLKKYGVDLIHIKKMFQLDKETLEKIWSIVSSAKEYKNKIYISLCEKNDPDMRTIVASAADELLNVKGVACSFVICNMGENFFISARSLGDINVQTIMEKMGGGGHITVAATVVDTKSITECINMLKDSINAVIN